MNILIIQEEDIIRKVKLIVIFDTLKEIGDKLHFCLSTDAILSANFTINIYKHVPLPSNINVRLSNNVDVYRYIPGDSHTVNEKHLYFIMVDIIHTIYNYKKIILKGIPLKDENQNRIKPILFLYAKNSLKYSLRFGTYFFEKNFLPNKCFQYETDEYFECKTTNPVLYSITLNRPLYFSNQTQYIELRQREDQEILLVSVVKDKINFRIEYTVEDYVRSIPTKMALEKFVNTNPYIEDLIVIKDAFLSEVVNNYIGVRFHEVIQRIKTRSSKINDRMLSEIIKGLPRFDDKDVRKVYLEHLIKCLKETTFNRKRQGELYKGDSLVIFKPLKEENSPFGSLHRYLN